MPNKSAERVPDAPESWASLPVEVKMKGEGPPGYFTGYASVFNVQDANGDVILPGAFKRTLRESGKAMRPPKMFVNHAGFATGMVGANDLIPIGVWDSLAEDRTGLAVEGHLIAMDTDRGKAIYAAMKEGVLADMSIGYRAITYTLGEKPTDPYRTISDLTLYEISPVFHPANPDARIVTVASLTGKLDPKDIRYLEGLLCDAGLSRREAKALLAEGHKAIRPQRDAGESESFDGLLTSLKAVNSALTR